MSASPTTFLALDSSGDENVSNTMDGELEVGDFKESDQGLFPPIDNPSSKVEDAVWVLSLFCFSFQLFFLQ